MSKIIPLHFVPAYVMLALVVIVANIPGSGY